MRTSRTNGTAKTTTNTAAVIVAKGKSANPCPSTVLIRHSPSAYAAASR